MRSLRAATTTGLCLSVLALGCSDPADVRECTISASNDCGDLILDEGGEVRAENLIYPDGTSHTLVSAHFFDAQNGGLSFGNVVTEPNVPLRCNWVGGSGGPGSTENPAPEKISPFGDASDELGVTATWAPGGRHYLDVGDAVSLQADGVQAITLQRYEDHLTPFAGGSFHSISYDPAPSADATLAIPADLMGGDGAIGAATQLEVTLSGGADFPQTAWGFDEEGPGIEIPPRPVILASEGNAIDWSAAGAPPASQDITRGEDLRLTYKVPADVAPDLLSYVTIYQTEPTFEVTHICYTTQVGQIILPGSVHAQMAPQGMIFVSNLYHRLRYLNEARRVDMVGVASTSSNYTLVD